MTNLDPYELLAINCGVSAREGDFLRAFENRYGELMVFYQKWGTPAGTLYHSDMGWEGIPVDDNAISFDKTLPGSVITVGGWILNVEEAGWLARCILATSEMRQRRR
ncbi:hypothetical protein [Cryptosporangium sp. NPDC048952]|uniref:hypothetical protein n=1 Tax=Cryptosporangium sp. NPDC048952 TaxID=3363961 RepID=UPI00371959C2